MASLHKAPYIIRPYFIGIFPYIGLIGLTYGRYLGFRFLKWPLMICYFMTCYEYLRFDVVRN